MESDHCEPLEVDCKVQNLRRSARLISLVKFQLPTRSTICANKIVNYQFLRRSKRLQSLRQLPVNSVSEGNVEELIETTKNGNGVDHWKPLEVHCKVQSLRRSMRLASKVTRKPLGVDAVSVVNVKELIETTKGSTGVDYWKPLELDCKVSSQRCSMRPAVVSSRTRKGLDKTPEDTSKLDPNIALENKKNCKSMSSQNWMRSRSLPATSNRVMNRGVVTLEVADEGKVVSEGHNADSVLDRNILCCASRKKRDCHKDKSRKREKDNQVENNIGKAETGECSRLLEWTKEQEDDLQKAYIMARPSPHFWKKVSRMVPGKSAQECFDKVHASFGTPLSIEPRSRRVKKSLSPIGNFGLTDGISSHISEFKVGRLRSCKTKKHAAQKIARHLLRKHCLSDQRNAADHFSLLESSPINIAVDIPYIQSSITSCCTSNSPCLDQQHGEQTSANVKMYSRFKLLTPPDRPSPEVLKQIKDRALHDKYIDELHCRDARRAVLRKKTSFASGSKCDRKTRCDTLKAARTALLSDAKSFINYFEHTPADMHELDNEDGDNYDANEDDDNGDIND